MVTQPPKDTPFGLEPNVAAGLAYFFGIIGGVVMLAGGGTNRYVRWASAQSITLWGAYIVLDVALLFCSSVLWMLAIIFTIAWMFLGILALILWLYTWINAFQGKEVRIPIIADWTQRFFGSMLAA